LRLRRIFVRLREGWAYDDIAREHEISTERVRQIVAKELEKVKNDDVTKHAKLQLARLQPALRLAGEAVADGHVNAIPPLLKVLDRLDRYQKSAVVAEVYDAEARQKLLDKLNRMAVNLGLDRKPGETTEPEGAVAAVPAKGGNEQQSLGAAASS
jgi:hypothetical protein